MRFCTTGLSFSIFLLFRYCIIRAPTLIFALVVVVAVVAVVAFSRIFIVDEFLFCCLFGGRSLIGGLLSLVLVLTLICDEAPPFERKKEGSKWLVYTKKDSAAYISRFTFPCVTVIFVVFP